MYHIYHIKGVKWGCSKELPNRLKRQGYTLDDVCEIVEQSDIDIASELEKEWNIRDGYNWNDSQDYRIITKAAPLGGKVAVQTMLDKRPSTKGEGNGRANITELQAKEILSYYDNLVSNSKSNYRLISKTIVHFSHISKYIVSKICTRTSWKHI